MNNHLFYGNLCSWFYDIEKPIPNHDELEFYLSFVNNSMKILEPMCGSGRFLAKFIEKGFKIDGFDISKEMLEKCNKKIEKIGRINKDIILSCCNFDEFKTNKEYDFIFIPSGSFSLITKQKDIIENLKILDQLCKSGGIIIIDLLIHENIGENIVQEHYSKNRTVKENNIEITLFKKIVKIDEIENIEYSMFKYELCDNGTFVKEEEEKFNVKFYKHAEFEKYIKCTSLKIKNKYINYEKEKYINQNTERIIYELIKE